MSNNYFSNKPKVCCIRCKDEITFNNINVHYESCNGISKKPNKVKYPDILNCSHCGKLCKNTNSFRNHERTCKSNPNRNYTNHKTGKPGSNQFSKAVSLGLPKPKVSDDTRNKLSTAGMGKKKSPETLKKLSQSMRLAVKNNPDSYSKHNVSGRVKLIEYKGHNLKGSWEFKTAQWLDSLGIKWEYESTSHEYTWNNDTHFYFPDFFLPIENAYIEVKGYKTERDKAKWAQFKFPLFIIDKNNIKNLSNYTCINDLYKYM